MSINKEIREWLNESVAKQNIELATERDIWKCEAERLELGYDALKAENESLRKDAQRYRWLRANNYYAHVQVMEVDGSMPYLYAEELDFGLDTAMGQGERS